MSNRLISINGASLFKVILVTLLHVVLGTGAILAQDIESDQFYTVVAKSGLNVRAEKSLESKKVGGLPFQAEVEVIPGAGNEEEISIDGRPGKWVKVRYRNIQGYVFSGYLKRGKLYIPSGEINNGYRILNLGTRCTAINYDPALIWYTFRIVSGESGCEAELKRSNLTIDYDVDESTFADGMHYQAAGEFVSVMDSVNKGGIVAIGVPAEIENPSGELLDCSDFTGKGLGGVGKFIYPYENYLYYEKGHQRFYLCARELASIEYSTSIKKEYLLINAMHDPHVGDEEEMKRKNIGAKLHWKNLISYQYGNHQGPRLIWKGDVNNDGFPDCIFYTPNMSESCGGSSWFSLLVSKKNTRGEFYLEAVAEEEFESCHGC
ncbi:SH3 domain-containing protein [Neolewinella lacunae]|uniref:SH3 domain-containing protein n=1 Tax=Neolewinella lacunae TaxID=1517758 RepID=A0A923PIS0_9BACT|nr:SH3 domain-containing protein [Neolewinella lacunae]MBC6993350.1 SH3 domain-containing protein [Neolewinella lacunae]MDN3636340.1 SH3 domain-containing protein [Neolewinella lacunae]